MNLKQTVFACSAAFLVSCSGGGSDSAGSSGTDPGAATTTPPTTTVVVTSTTKYADIPGIGDAVGVPTSTAAGCGDATSPGLPSGFVRCGGEYTTCTLPSASDVAYGAPGSYSVKYNLSGSVQLINSVFGDPAYGESKSGFYRPTDPVASRNALTATLAWVRDHVAGVKLLTPAQLNTLRMSFDIERGFLGSDPVLVKAAREIVTSYESKSGAFFVSTRTPPRFASCSATVDNLEADRAVYSIQQGLADAISADMIAKYPVLVDGLKYQTAAYFPGAVEPPADALSVRSVQINASMPTDWGRRTAFSQGAVRRPTGYYLAPGSLATITVPDALVNKGFEILVGAHTLTKRGRERFDRVSKLFPITSRTMQVANPFGGGIYVMVPYQAAAGNVAVGIANAVRSPLFQNTSLHKTSAAEWMTERLNPGPWADFETDKFMMNMPRSMIYAQGDMTPVMAAWDKAMDGVSEVMGYPLVRNNVVLFRQLDVSIAAGVYAPGYPQVNNDYSPKSTQNGNSTAWWFRDPMQKNGSSTEFHELGHAQLIPSFGSEGESAVHILKAYTHNVKFGADIDTAFSESDELEGGTGLFSRDQVAIGWMIRANFRAGLPMDATNSESNEIRYQHRGHAKYVEIAGLFGRKAIARTNRQLNLDVQNGVVATDKLNGNDRWILNLSKGAGVDLTPLIHFWGTQPVDATALAAAIDAAKLPRSQRIYDRLVRYQGMIPLDNAGFMANYNALYPNNPSDAGNPLYQYGWYKANAAGYGPAQGNAAVVAMQGIVQRYFPGGRPATDVVAATK